MVCHIISIWLYMVY